MAGLKRFQYVDKDYNAIVDDVIARVKQTYGEDRWNDFEEDNAGKMLIEIFAYVTDLLLFYLDRQANETFLPTATERQNIINLCALIGYVPKNSIPARANILVSLDSLHGYDVTLPANTLLQTQSGLSFETIDDAIIKAGELNTYVEAIEGETFIETIGISNGEGWQNFYLLRSGVLEILSITINNHEWKQVASLADQLPEAKVFTAEIDAWRRAEILFGDGKNGMIPELDEAIIVKYRIGGGLAGNVAPDTITNVRNVAIDTHGNSVNISVTNPDWATGGAESESIDSIKLWAPRFFETQNRCVTQQDYETFSKKFDGIAKAKARVHERSGEANVIRIYVLSYGIKAGTLALATDALKNALLEYLEKYKQLTDWIEIEDGKFTPIDFKGKVIISDGFIASKILENIKDTLSKLMNIEVRSMGETLRISDVYAALDNIEGVMYVELDNPLQSVTPDFNEIFTLGDVNFDISLRKDRYGQNI